MKKIKKHIRLKIAVLLIILVPGVYSCHDFLELEPMAFLSPEQSFESAKNLERAIVAVYDALGHLYGGTTHWQVRTGLECDEGIFRERSTMGGWSNFTYNASAPEVQTLYSQLYSGVERANLFLENVDNNPNIDVEFRNRLKGEAHFLRGHFYFVLVQLFGGTPLVTVNPKDPNEVFIPRATTQEIYEQVLSDMLIAEKLVPDIQDIGFGGRVSKSAVRGSLARVYLHMAGYPLNDKSKYAESEKWALKIINEGYHELNPVYSDIFINYAADKYDIKESIFEVEYWGNRYDAYLETAGIGAGNGVPSSNPKTGICTGMLLANKYLYNLYKEGDIRRGWNIANFVYAATGENGAKKFLSASQMKRIHERYAGKFRREYEVVTPKMPHWTPQNMPLLRYADVLLMFAEANNEINSHPTPEAIEAVNKVKRRGWAIGGIKSITVSNRGSGYTKAPTVLVNGDSTVAVAKVSGGRVISVDLTLDAVTGTSMGKYNSPPEVIFISDKGSGATASVALYSAEDAELTSLETSSKDSFREAIMDERARELCYESLRKFDLIRWGIYVKRMHEVADIINEHHTPIGFRPIFYERYMNVQEKHNLFPIPELELVRNHALRGHQNPGWE